ncbi:MAG: transketolase [Myxococcota bacterium]
MSSPSSEAIAQAARAIRILTIDAVRRAGSGHVGLPLGCAELAVVLFSEFLRFDPDHPDWPDRDRFVLSGGHGSMLLYSLLHLTGYAIGLEDLRRFRQLHSITPGHPEHGLTPGVEATTGPLGQGLANAVGMALAERILAARFGSELVDHRTYVLASDGDMMEGVAAEAASLAGHLALGRLVVLYDDNRITIDGPTRLCFSESVAQRFDAYGWNVQQIDGQAPAEVRAALAELKSDEARPHLIVCRTHIGFGSPAVDSAGAHGTLGDERTEQTRENLGWELPPLELPDGVGEVFRANAERGRRLRESWEARRDQALEDPGLRDLWRAMLEGRLPEDLGAVWPDFRGGGPLATRKASGKILNALAPHVPSLMGGSADLAGSNATLLTDESAVEPGKFQGRNLFFGIREHGMAAIANGLSLHGGIRPYIGTFLIFSDYMRPALRMAALMGEPVVYVFTHDSIFVGEDGPTHQPVEQLATLRALPNLWLWRPADARETVAAWRAALHREEGPVALALTRQDVPVLAGDDIEASAARGAYVLHREPREPLELVIVASGSEVHVALEVAGALSGEGHAVRVVSLPCLEVFRAQEASYQSDVLPQAPPRLLVEAGVPQGLAELTRPGDRFHGMTGFGASAPYGPLAREFGFTPEALLPIARSLLSSRVSEGDR